MLQYFLIKTTSKLKEPLMVFFSCPLHKNRGALNRPHSAIRKGNYKLIKFQDDKTILLFNLVKDKMEQINLAHQKKSKRIGKYIRQLSN